MGKRSAGCKFPVARIKKIIQADEEVGKVAASTPVAVCKALEMFIDHILDASAREAQTAGARKVTPYHLKRAVNDNETFDFLRDMVAKVPDPVGEDKSKRRKGSNATLLPSSSGAEAGASTPEDKSVPARRPRRAAAKAAPAEEAEEKDEEDADEPPRKRGRQTTRIQAPKEEPSSSEATSVTEEPPASAPAPPALDEDEEDYDAE